MFQFLGQAPVCFFSIQVALPIKENMICRIYKSITQILRHQDTVQVFSPGSRVIQPLLILKILSNFLKLTVQRQAQSQSIDNLLIALLNFFQFFPKSIVIRRCLIAVIQHICHLNIAAVSFSRRRRHYISASFIGADDLSHFFKLLCARQ